MITGDIKPYLSILQSLWAIVGEGAEEPKTLAEWSALVERVQRLHGVEATEIQYRDEIRQWRMAASYDSASAISTPRGLVSRLESIGKRISAVEAEVEGMRTEVRPLREQLEQHLRSTAVEGSLLDEMIGGVRFQISIDANQMTWLINGYVVGPEKFAAAHDAVCGSIAVRKYEEKR